jgi:hypothetical protein
MQANKIRKMTMGVLPAILLLAPIASRAQSCNSSGADGAYSPTASGVFDPVALGLNAAGDNVFNFTSVTIPSNVTITMQAHLMKSQRPVVFLVSGAVNILGALTLSGASGNPAALQFESRTAAEPGPGGYPGGVGAMPNTSTPGGGAGPGGASAPSNTLNGCSASYTYQGVGGSGCTAASSATYGNPQLLPLVGGSGGSGTASTSAQYTGAGGGAGGGAIRICSDGPLTINQLYANGGDGAIYGPSYAGAGSGGAIHLQSPSVTLNYGGGEYIQAVGGSQPGIGSTSVGRIRVDTNNLVGGATNPAAYFSSLLTGPYDGVPLPTPPTITVASINGIAVPGQPLNRYSPPDVSITPAVTGAIPIVVNTTGIPNGTTATFYIATDSSVSPGSPDIVQTATVNNNTATLNVTLPAGVNRLYVRAVF